MTFTPPQPQRPSDSQLLYNEFREQGLSHDQAIAVLTATSDHQAAAAAARNRWADRVTAEAERAYRESAEGRLAHAREEAGRIEAKQNERAELVRQAELILSANPSFPSGGLEVLSDQEKLEHAGIIERDRPFEGTLVDPNGRLVQS